MASLPAEGGDAPAPDPQRLAAALERLGVAAGVETMGRLAVLTLADPARMPAPAVRSAILAAGRDAGFSNVAVELLPDTEPSA